MNRSGSSIGVALLAAWAITGCGGGMSARDPAPDGPKTLAATLQPRAVSALDLRWRDIAGEPYAGGFQDPAYYYHTDRSRVEVQWQSSAGTFAGRLEAKRLKPNFAYQMKLVGRAPVASARVAPAAESPEEWASWQLGRLGRWWCEDCLWNIPDAEVPGHLSRGHRVLGYLLFGYFITDDEGNADRRFSLDSSHHVLWRTDQRSPNSDDGPPAQWQVRRGQWGYGLNETGEGPLVGIFPEHEALRPPNGQVMLPAGDYPVRINITEESFHDNLNGPVEGGGYWAQVLEADVDFHITDRPQPASLRAWKARRAVGSLLAWFRRG